MLCFPPPWYVYVLLFGVWFVHVKPIKTTMFSVFSDEGGGILEFAKSESPVHTKQPLFYIFLRSQIGDLYSNIKRKGWEGIK